jgi:hypothetical protein
LTKPQTGRIFIKAAVSLLRRNTSGGEATKDGRPEQGDHEAQEAMDDDRPPHRPLKYGGGIIRFQQRHDFRGDLCR